MTERLVSKRLFWQTPVSGITVSGPISSAVDVRTGVVRLEGLDFILSSVASTPDCGFFYALSTDGVTWGSFSDNTALQASTFSGGNPQGFHTIALPTVLSPYIRFSLSGTGSNPADTKATVDLWIRMNQ